MEWSEDAEIRLIEELKKHRCLWDPKDKDKKNRNKIKDAYDAISTEMEMEYNLIKLKKESLIRCYRSYARNVNKSKKSGAGVDDVYTPVWKHYKEMDAFLSGTCAPKTTYEVMGNEEEDDEIVEEIEEVPAVPVKRPRKNKTEEAISTALNSLNTAIVNRPQKDQYQMFGDLLAANLRELSKRRAQDVMYQMQGVMHIAMTTPDHHNTSLLQPSTSFPHSQNHPPLPYYYPQQSTPYNQNQNYSSFSNHHFTNPNTLPPSSIPLTPLQIQNTPILNQSPHLSENSLTSPHNLTSPDIQSTSSYYSPTMSERTHNNYL